jgi:putative lipoprotein
MNPHRERTHALPPLVLLAFLATHTLSAQRPPTPTQAPYLGGTSWQLIEFEGGDGTRVVPDDKAKYTLAFGRDGRVNVRIDCNRGSATWKSSARNQLEFGPLAITRVMCPRGSMHDRIVRHWPFVRSYVVRDGHLFLSLMADGGIYEFEPMSGEVNRAGSVRGTAAYRERIALPTNAVFEAILEDVSRAGARAEVIARILNEQPGNPPIPFVIAYDPARINANRRYVVRARILVAGELWFSTDQNYPVLTAGHGSEVQLLLRRVHAPASTVPYEEYPSVASLENTYWKLITLPDHLVAAAPQQREAHFILNPANRSVSGSGGCNRLGGSYELNGDRISFRKVASTMMACVDPISMSTEARFLNALGRVTRWRITGQRLDLFDATGTPLIRLDAVYLR